MKKIKYILSMTLVIIGCGVLFLPYLQDVNAYQLRDDISITTQEQQPIYSDQCEKGHINCESDHTLECQDGHLNCDGSHASSAQKSYHTTQSKHHTKKHIHH